MRTTLFVSGCTNHCPGCFQKETWDFDYGKPYTEKTEQDILDSLDHEYIDGLTLLGGEPFEFSNQEALIRLLRKVKERFPTKSIWCYTGFVLDQDLLLGGKRHGPYTEEMLSYLNVLVDGPFQEERKNIMLKFRGSENQRIIDVPASLAKQEIVLLEDLM